MKKNVAKNPQHLSFDEIMDIRYIGITIYLFRSQITQHECNFILKIDSNFTSKLLHRFFCVCVPTSLSLGCCCLSNCSCEERIWYAMIIGTIGPMFNDTTDGWTRTKDIIRFTLVAVIRIFFFSFRGSFVFDTQFL